MNGTKNGQDMGSGEKDGPLDGDQIEDFIEDGYVKLEGAFAKTLAEQCRAILWEETGLDPDDPAGWTSPVIRLGDHSEKPFVEAANTSTLHAAFDQLVGPGRWLPRGSLGTFPIRFPAEADPGDAGWHIDVSFPGDGDDPLDFLIWRANLRSRGRALLMLFLFSDTQTDDAPTRIRAGSHKDVARMLAPAGEAGMTLADLAANDFQESAHRPERLATGDAGTVYLCHPFLVHAAQPHRGRMPRFMAQPPLLPKGAFRVTGNPSGLSPAEEAIRRALAQE
jgi:hypothetical protein